MSRLLCANLRTITRIRSSEYRDMHAGLVRKPNKYRAKRQTVDGLSFASKHEAKVYGELKLRERAGEITDLRLQPRYHLTINDTLICTYVGDFEFTEAGRIVCVDAKGMPTPAYTIKRTLFKVLYPNIEHREA